jgi:hypothetical protein
MMHSLIVGTMVSRRQSIPSGFFKPRRDDARIVYFPTGLIVTFTHNPLFLNQDSPDF